MKAFRVTVLTACLLVGATAQPITKADRTSIDSSQTIAAKGAGECWMINGVWYCEP
jgi:hypothetical protein